MKNNIRWNWMIFSIGPAIVFAFIIILSDKPSPIFSGLFTFFLNGSLVVGFLGYYETSQQVIEKNRKLEEERVEAEHNREIMTASITSIFGPLYSIIAISVDGIENIWPLGWSGIGPFAARGIRCLMEEQASEKNSIQVDGIMMKPLQIYASTRQLMLPGLFPVVADLGGPFIERWVEVIRSIDGLASFNTEELEDDEHSSIAYDAVFRFVRAVDKFETAVRQNEPGHQQFE